MRIEGGIEDYIRAEKPNGRLSQAQMESISYKLGIDQLSTSDRFAILCRMNSSSVNALVNPLLSAVTARFMLETGIPFDK